MPDRDQKNKWKVSIMASPARNSNRISNEVMAQMKEFARFFHGLNDEEKREMIAQLRLIVVSHYNKFKQEDVYPEHAGPVGNMLPSLSMFIDSMTQAVQLITSHSVKPDQKDYFNNVLSSATYYREKVDGEFVGDTPGIFEKMIQTINKQRRAIDASVYRAWVGPGSPFPDRPRPQRAAPSNGKKKGRKKGSANAPKKQANGQQPNGKKKGKGNTPKPEAQNDIQQVAPSKDLVEPKAPEKPQVEAKAPEQPKAAVPMENVSKTTGDGSSGEKQQLIKELHALTSEDTKRLETMSVSSLKGKLTTAKKKQSDAA